MTDLSAEPRTGTQHDIAAGDYEATVTELGAGLRRLRYRGRPLIREYEADEVPPAGAGQLLIPWPNRVDRGRYDFGGTQLPAEPERAGHGNAIHGLTRFANWPAVGGQRRPGRSGRPGRPAARAARPARLPVLPGADGQLSAVGRQACRWP